MSVLVCAEEVATLKLRVELQDGLADYTGVTSDALGECGLALLRDYLKRLYWLKIYLLR